MYNDKINKRKNLKKRFFYYSIHIHTEDCTSQVFFFFLFYRIFLRMLSMFPSDYPDSNFRYYYKLFFLLGYLFCDKFCQTNKSINNISFIIENRLGLWFLLYYLFKSQYFWYVWNETVFESFIFAPRTRVDSF